MTAGLQTVHVRVNDSATGQPTAVRIGFTDKKGRYYAPLGRQAKFARGWNEDVGGNLHLERWTTDAKGNRQIDARKYAFIDGTCEIRLPPGPINVEVHKGPEYTPLREEITLPPGKMALRLSIARWINLGAEGWYSGDTRSHFLTPHAALLEAAAEDVAVANLLAEEVDLPGYDPDPNKERGRQGRYPAIPNILAFSGQRPALEVPGHMVVVNTQNNGGRAGQLSLLNCHRVVYPLRFGSSPRAGGWRGCDNWTLADWSDQCRRKKGLVVWSNIAWSSEEPSSECGEALADLIVGKVDAFEIWPYSSPYVFKDWYKLLNCGFQIPLAGASGKNWNNHPLGFVRTYARLREGDVFNYANWIEAVRAGRTFISMGPLLKFTVDGHEPGSVIRLSNPGKVHVHAEASSLEPFERLELIVNGKLLHTCAPSGLPCRAVLDVDVPIKTNSWLGAACSPELPYIMTHLFLSAHTSPIYVRLEGQPVRAPRKTVAELTSCLDRMLEWARHEARSQTEQQRERFAGILEAARAELLRRCQGRAGAR